MSGAIWKSNGYQEEENTNDGKARFPNGIVIENRGNNGKLFDIYGKLKPSEPKQKASISYDG